MATAVTAAPTQREPELAGQTVVVIGGSSGMGLETARRARGEGANVILTGRKPDALRRAALEVDALSTAAFDADDPAALEGGAIVRVTLPRSALRSFGLPVTESDGTERVFADLLVSEDGTPQAIRLVSDANPNVYF